MPKKGNILKIKGQLGAVIRLASILIYTTTATLVICTPDMAVMALVVVTAMATAIQTSVTEPAFGHTTTGVMDLISV